MRLAGMKEAEAGTAWQEEEGSGRRELEAEACGRRGPPRRGQGGCRLGGGEGPLAEGGGSTPPRPRPRPPWDRPSFAGSTPSCSSPRHMSAGLARAGGPCPSRQGAHAESRNSLRIRRIRRPVGSDPLPHRLVQPRIDAKQVGHFDRDFCDNFCGKEGKIVHRRRFAWPASLPRDSEEASTARFACTRKHHTPGPIRVQPVHAAPLSGGLAVSESSRALWRV